MHPARRVRRLAVCAQLRELLRCRRRRSGSAPRRRHALPDGGGVQLGSSVSHNGSLLELADGGVGSLERCNHASKHVRRDALAGASALVAPARQLWRGAHVQLHVGGAVCARWQSAQLASSAACGTSNARVRASCSRSCRMLVRCAVSSAMTSSGAWLAAAPASAASRRDSASSRASCGAGGRGSVEHALTDVLQLCSHAPSSEPRRTQRRVAGRLTSFARRRRSTRTCTSAAAALPRARPVRGTACSCRRPGDRTAPADRPAPALARPCRHTAALARARYTMPAAWSNNASASPRFVDRSWTGPTAEARPAARGMLARARSYDGRHGSYDAPATPAPVPSREPAAAATRPALRSAPRTREVRASLPWPCARRRASCSAAAPPASQPPTAALCRRVRVRCRGALL